MLKVPGVDEAIVRVLAPHVVDWWQGNESHMVALHKGSGEVGDLDNWRDICLLQLLSKVVAILVNDRLGELAERLLDEAQMGFRRFRG